MNWFRPRNSILLLEDLIDRETTDSFEKAILEVKKYYAFETLSKVTRTDKKSRGLGFACLIIKEPRKFFFHRILPFLRDENIPFTILLRPDEVGTNRLSPEEELKIYEEKDEPLVSARRQFLMSIQDKESFRSALREHLGLFPFETQDPLRFYMTWGQISQITTGDVEVGMIVDRFCTESKFQEDKKFVMQHTKKELSLLFSEGKLSFEDDFPKLSLEKGLVQKHTPWQALPIWKLQIGMTEK